MLQVERVQSSKIYTLSPRTMSTDDSVVISTQPVSSVSLRIPPVDTAAEAVRGSDASAASACTTPECAPFCGTVESFSPRVVEQLSCPRCQAQAVHFALRMRLRFCCCFPPWRQEGSGHPRFETYCNSCGLVLSDEFLRSRGASSTQSVPPTLAPAAPPRARETLLIN